MKIWLADLTHTGLGVATEAMPLNIGLLKSYVHKMYPNEFEIKLFKYPEVLNSALQESFPDIIGFSNYTWNSNLSYFFSQKIKKMNSATLVVWGGTNYPFDSANQFKFLKKRPYVDIHVAYEGEITFAEIVNKFKQLKRIEKLKLLKVAGCQSIVEDKLMDGGFRPRIKDLSSIPSPYVNGFMDEFFDGRLTPLVETARGCPFTCNFCNAGDKYFQKVNTFDTSYAIEELEYISKKAKASGTGHITFCDNNFGMLSRDSELALALQKFYEKYGFPSSTTVWTGKNSKERVIEATRILGDKLNISMSVQAMDPEVLREIKRDNIRIEDYKKIAQELNFQGRPQHAEVIMPLPGETFDSHITGLLSLVDTKVDRVFSHTLQLLHGTPYKDNEIYRKINQFVIKYRLVPADFSIIDNVAIFDVEEVAVGTNKMSFEQYLEARFYALIVDLAFNTNSMKLFIKFLDQHDIPISSLIKVIVKNVEMTKYDFTIVLESFRTSTVEELWNSEDELVDYYSKPENLEKLKSGTLGVNVLFKHRVWMLSEYSKSWINFISFCCKELLSNQASPDRLIILEEITGFTQELLVDAFNIKSIDTIKNKKFKFDVLEWYYSNENKNITEFFGESEVSFQINDNKKTVLRDAYRRYGTDLYGYIKLIQRTNYSPTFEGKQKSSKFVTIKDNKNQFWKSL